MSSGGPHDAEVGTSRKKAYWEHLDQIDLQADPEFMPREEDLMEDEDTSSDEDMRDEPDGEDATTTGSGGDGDSTDGSCQSKKQRKERTPITVGLKRSI